jgi:tetratricopeptide (TPR) repeat protein
MDPDFAATHFWLGYAYMKNAMYEEAIKEMQKETTYRHAYVYSTIGVIYNLMGNKDKALQILDELTEQSQKEGLLHKEQVSFYGIARLHFSLEEDDLGFDWLNKAYEARDVDMYYMKVDFLMDRVRSDPRFISLLKKMNLD